MRIHHIGIMVSDIERSVAWYQRVLGFRVADRRELGRTRLAFLELAGAQIELIQQEGSCAAEGIVNHIAFAVDDLDAAMARLRAEGVSLGDERVIPIWDGGRVLFFEGPDGEVLELFEAGRPAAGRAGPVARRIP
ncbi:MAG: VOC family protein [Bacillota bacterium]